MRATRGGEMSMIAHIWRTSSASDVTGRKHIPEMGGFSDASTKTALPVSVVGCGIFECFSAS